MIPVKYVGLQQGVPESGIPDFYLVNEPSGTTVQFNPEKHTIVGLSDSAKSRNIHIPIELIFYCYLPEHIK